MKLERIASTIGEPIDQVLSMSGFQEVESQFIEQSDVEPKIYGVVLESIGVEFNLTAENFVESAFVSVTQSDLIDDLPASTSILGARKRFGEPVSSSAGGEHEILGKIDPWDRFRWSDDLDLHLTYAPDTQALRRVSIIPH